MPTYEYVCTDCKNEWEDVQKISEPALNESVVVTHTVHAVPAEGR